MSPARRKGRWRSPIEWRAAPLAGRHRGAAAGSISPPPTWTPKKMAITSTSKQPKGEKPAQARNFRRCAATAHGIQAISTGNQPAGNNQRETEKQPISSKKVAIQCRPLVSRSMQQAGKLTCTSASWPSPPVNFGLDSVSNPTSVLPIM